MINWSLYMAHLFRVLCTIHFLFQSLIQDAFICFVSWDSHVLWQLLRQFICFDDHDSLGEARPGILYNVLPFQCVWYFPPRLDRTGVFSGCIKGTRSQYKALTFSVIAQLWMLIISLLSAFPPHSGRKSLCSLLLGSRGPCSCFWRAIPH